MITIDKRYDNETVVQVIYKDELHVGFRLCANCGSHGSRYTRGTKFIPFATKDGIVYAVCSPECKQAMES